MSPTTVGYFQGHKTEGSLQKKEGEFLFPQTNKIKNIKKKWHADLILCPHNSTFQNSWDILSYKVE